MLVRYEIHYWDEIDNQARNERGIVSSENLGFAVNHVCDFYGNENVNKITVYELEEILADEEIHDMLIEE